jgi:hypothetical protein
MAIAFVQQAVGTQAAGTTATVTLGVNPTTGNTLVAFCYSSAGDVSGVSGGGVTTWTLLKGPGVTQHCWANIYYGVVDTTPATGITITATSGIIAGNVSEFSGIKTSGAADASSDQDGTNSTAPASGPITASAGPALYLGLMGTGGTISTGPADSFTGSTAADVSGRKCRGAYRIDTTPASATPSWTLSGVSSWDVIVGALQGTPDVTNAPGGNAAGTGASHVAGPVVSVGAYIASAVATVSTGRGSDLDLEAPAASATGAAYTAPANVRPSATAGAATGTAHQPPLSATIGGAAATGAASQPGATVRPTATAAAATGAASNAAATVAPNAALASPIAFAAALTASVDTTTYASAQAASATGAASGASETVAPNAQAIAATGAASGPGIVSDSATTVASGYGTAQAQAVLAFAAIAAASGYGSSTGAAHDAAVTVSVPAGVGSATVAALVARAGSFTGPSAGRGPRGRADRPRPSAVAR